MATHVPTTLVLVSFQHHKRVADELVQEPDLDFVGNDLELTELLLRPLSVVEMHGPEIVTVPSKSLYLLVDFGDLLIGKVCFASEFAEGIFVLPQVEELHLPRRRPHYTANGITSARVESSGLEWMERLLHLSIIRS